MTRTSAAYRDTLCRYYEEEIEGEAYFAELAWRCAEPRARHRLHLLAEVERHAARAAAPLIARHGIAPKDRAALVASGIAEARAAPADWALLAAEMRESYPGYVAAFRRLEALGPPEDAARLAFLTEHEVAALDFLHRAHAGEAGAEAALHRYLRATPAEAPR